MKKIILSAVSVLILSSCAITGPYYREYANSIDYSKYSEKGFFLTESNSVSFNYTPIATVYCVIENGYVRVVDGKEYQLQGETYGSKNLEWKKGYADTTLDKLYQEAKKLGADGIINLQFSNNRASGMAIKRK